MQNKVLIVDGDTRSLRLLEVSLKQAGYRVVTATSGIDALSQLEVEIPDLVLADTDIGEVDGFALYARLQQRPEWAHLPFIFILDGDNPAEKLRAVQLGAGDFLTKPVFLKEALSRVELLLEKQAQRGERGPGQATTSGRARFAGALSGTALLDLLQTMELGRKSGIAYCVSGRGQRATVYFADGVVVDAELGRRSGMDAFYRILTFAGGEYRVELLTVVRQPRIEIGAPGLLMEAMRYLEEWNRLCAALPPLTAPLTPLGGTAGALRPESLPAELRETLQLFDGRRSVLDVLDLLDQEAESPPDALMRLGAVAKLYAARLLTPAGRPISGEPRAPVPTPLAVPRLSSAPTARLTPPPMPRLTPPPMPRLTPPPLVGGRAAALAGLGRPTPVSLPRAIVKTPAPVGDSGALTLSEDLLITLVPGLPQEEQAALHHTSAASSSDESLTPLPPPFPAAARPTPVEQPAVHSVMPQPFPKTPPLPGDATSLRPAIAAARLTPPPTPLEASGVSRPPRPELARARLTPPPIPQERAARMTPVVPLTPLEVARPPAFATERLTPPQLPATRTARLTPEPPPATIEAAMPTSAAGRLTPPPMPPARMTPEALRAQSAAATPPMPAFAEERLTPPALAHSAVRLTPAALRAQSEAAIPPMQELAEGWMPPPSSESEMTLEAQLETIETAASTIPELRLARLTPATAVDAADVVDAADAAAPPTEPPSTRPPDAPARAPSEGASPPGHNLARLAQRLAATRQPLPFAPPPLPNFAVTAVAAAPVSSEPAAGSRQLATASAPGVAAATASQSWIGSLPELEPISIPEFELTIEHSAPSWAQGSPPLQSSAAPSSELKANKTLPVHLRSQPKAAAAELDHAVHVSAPVPLPAEAASISLPPIEIEAPPAHLLLPVPPPAVSARKRWGKVVAGVIAGTALFSLGAGLYWVRQELDRGITVTLPQREEPPAPRVPPPTVNKQVAAEAAQPGPAKPEPAPTPAPPSAAPAAAEAPPPAVPDNQAGQLQSAAAVAAAAPQNLPAAAPPASTTASADPAASAATQPSGELAALLARARAFEHRGALTQAYHAVRSAQRLQPRSAEVFALLAQLSLDEGNANKAAGLAKRALSLNKSNADAYLVLGTVEQARSHAAKARVYFKKYLALAPTGDRAVEVRAVLRLGQH